jgi:hypothetical protein
MRRNNKVNPNLAKVIARQKYAERKVDTWWKWSFENRNKVIYKELVEVQNKYGIKCYG